MKSKALKTARIAGFGLGLFSFDIEHAPEIALKSVLNMRVKGMNLHSMPHMTPLGSTPFPKEIEFVIVEKGDKGERLIVVHPDEIVVFNPEGSGGTADPADSVDVTPVIKAKGDVSPGSADVNATEGQWKDDGALPGDSVRIEQTGEEKTVVAVPSNAKLTADSNWTTGAINSVVTITRRSF